VRSPCGKCVHEQANTEYRVKVGKLSLQKCVQAHDRIPDVPLHKNLYFLQKDGFGMWDPGSRLAKLELSWDELDT